MRFALDGRVIVLEVSREDALDLLAFLGLDRPEFGAIEVRALLPLCRRRLWLEPRNVDAACARTDGTSRPAGTLQRLARGLAARITDAPSARVHFG